MENQKINLTIRTDPKTVALLDEAISHAPKWAASLPAGATTMSEFARQLILAALDGLPRAAREIDTLRTTVRLVQEARAGESQFLRMLLDALLADPSAGAKVAAALEKYDARRQQESAADPGAARVLYGPEPEKRQAVSAKVN